MTGGSADLGTIGGGAVSAPTPPRVFCLAEWGPRPDPAWQQILTSIAGRNLYGDPMLRLIHGSARLELMGGIWVNVEEADRGLPALRYQWDQRYPWAEDFWLVEEWVPVQVSPEAWERQERQWEDGLSYLEHPLYPSRGRYVWYTQLRRLVGQVEVPDVPTPGVLRSLAQRWRRVREKVTPAELQVTAAKRDQVVAANLREARKRKETKRLWAKKVNRDLLENEVGMPIARESVSLNGLEVPR